MERDTLSRFKVQPAVPQALSPSPSLSHASPQPPLPQLSIAHCHRAALVLNETERWHASVCVRVRACCRTTPTRSSSW
jgi:hypothetical protein